ncbi:unnamed protein product, partial [Arabidopsis halleri]
CRLKNYLSLFSLQTFQRESDFDRRFGRPACLPAYGSGRGPVCRPISPFYLAVRCIRLCSRLFRCRFCCFTELI